MLNEVQAERAFQRPQWYLNRHRYNITIRSEVVREFIGNQRPRQILDIGCGDGSISTPLLESGVGLTLFDRSAAMLGLARSRVAEGFLDQVEDVCGDFMRTDLKAGFYDLVICLGVLPYVEASLTFIERVCSLLSPQGFLITDCTDAAHPITQARNAYYRMLDLVRERKVRPFQRSSAECLGAYQKQGLTLLRQYRYCLPPPLLERCFGDDFHCGMIHGIFGTPGRNRNAWLGNEGVYLLSRKASSVKER